MANILKELVQKRTTSVIKSVVDPKLVLFKRMELGGNSDTHFLGIKDGKGNNIFWVVLLDDFSGFGRDYDNIIKKGSDPIKEQEAMGNAWKKIRKFLATKKADVALLDPDIPNNENPFPLTAKLVTEDKTPASKTSSTTSSTPFTPPLSPSSPISYRSSQCRLIILITTTSWRSLCPTRPFGNTFVATSSF